MAAHVAADHVELHMTDPGQLISGEERIGNYGDPFLGVGLDVKGQVEAGGGIVDDDGVSVFDILVGLAGNVLLAVRVAVNALHIVFSGQDLSLIHI